MSLGVCHLVALTPQYFYAFIVHLSTFLSLLIPAISSLPSLAPKSFLAIWILSVIPATLAGGRWKYCALTFAGISGGWAISFCCLAFHPFRPAGLLSRFPSQSSSTHLSSAAFF